MSKTDFNALGREIADWYHTTRPAGGPTLAERIAAALAQVEQETVNRCAELPKKAAEHWKTLLTPEAIHRRSEAILLEIEIRDLLQDEGSGA